MSDSDETGDLVPQKTRERLVRAARDCIRDRGLAGASSREITRVAGANLAAITYHFGSKDALVAAALFDELERRVAPALRALDRKGAPAERMLAAIRELAAEFERSREDALVLLEVLLLATRDDRYRAEALRVYQSLRGRLAQLIAELQADNAVPSWVAPDAMASLILAVAHGIVLETQLDPSGADHTAMAGQFAGLLLEAARH
jgi:AcrR family transcriptional regulator